jgi:hypothetical protein
MHCHLVTFLFNITKNICKKETSTLVCPSEHCLHLQGKYRVIHKSLWDFRPLRYSIRYGHAEWEHVNRVRETPKFLSFLTGARYIHPWWHPAPDKRFSHTLDSLGRWPRPACSFRSAQAATLLEFHVLFMNCFVRRWFCVVHGEKVPMHRHNWLSFGKSKTERFFIHCPRHVSSGLPP